MCLPSRLSIIQVSFTHLNYIFRNTDNYNVLSLELGTQGILVRILRSPIPFFLKKKKILAPTSLIYSSAELKILLNLEILICWMIRILFVLSFLVLKKIGKRYMILLLPPLQIQVIYTVNGKKKDRGEI
jgi:hypothetical protein